MDSLKDLISEYKLKKNKIKNRLKKFRKLRNGKYRDIFPELCFCLLTPQSNARHCDKAIRELKNKNLLFNGPARCIKAILKGKARFHNKKAHYIIDARKRFDGKFFRQSDARCMREILVKSIKGLGYKEASHFLRNIGLGSEIAILDRHILKNLKECGIIDRVPPSLSPKTYIDIEERARKFADEINIPLGELDLLFWSRETGVIFK